MVSKNNSPMQFPPNGRVQAGVYQAYLIAPRYSPPTAPLPREGV